MTHDVSGGTPRKTRLALMGEFSAGKSTLIKLFLGEHPLPIKITATRLPPVLISHGEEAAYAVGHDGVETCIDIDEIEQVRLEETRLIRLYKPCDTLEICDLIDMPGISDPSMSSDVWMSVMDEVDSVVWCTQATQAAAIGSRHVATDFGTHQRRELSSGDASRQVPFRKGP